MMQHREPVFHSGAWLGRYKCECGYAMMRNREAR